MTPTPTTGALEDRVWSALAEVLDPEIPAVSIVDMGMVGGLEIREGEALVTILPTFTGCPAIPVIVEDVSSAVAKIEGIEEVDVKTSFDPPWTQDRISDEGRRKLKDFGLAPPTGEGPVLITGIGLPSFAECPYCSSRNTRNENMFGPTPCRAVYYCNDCRNPFEQFKTV